ncbi:MAG: MBL fold metallo-hydrolase [Pseudomonadota bacterium]|nr:MBL fold metallo-hydrolase [Pseudomonadota bacterium]
MSLTFTILGCGTSGGVPRIGGDWGKCDPANPRNRRRRCALLVERQGPNGVTRILVDTPPDIRQQLLDVGVGLLDGVLFTHDHADHTHGIDDLRVVAFNARRRVNVYYDGRTGAILHSRFSYCFNTPEDSAYPPILNGTEIKAGRSFIIEGPGGAIEAMPFLQGHGEIESLGFRFGGLAYSPDINRLPGETRLLLQDLDIWIVDALRHTRHPSHFSLSEALEAIGVVKPKRAILTHMHVDMDYDTLRRELPPGVEPAYDGMVMELDG